MRKLTFLSFIAIIIIGTNSCSEKKCKYDSDEEKSKIEIVLEKYVIANETQDLDLVHRVWASRDDIVVFGTASDEKLIGWEKISKTFQQQFNLFEDTYISVGDQIITVNETGNTAWFSEIINYNFIYKGKPVSYEGVRFTGVLSKIEGEWYIVQSHMSLPHEEDFDE
ncbi:MAG: nuclear transport factor 2 family protein [Bacteroidales bacterium]|nr:nuclear transport factor 2 family protein [Bacteroidales bacterium]